ncbi:MAG: polysaccharide deacetylase family protein [Betaproteobacteria bacterium]|nr:polysaccharide deacetylase family protein [Betaproteobacteria bacterium]
MKHLIMLWIACCLLPLSASAGLPLPIVVYHKVQTEPIRDEPGQTVISLARFEAQMRYLAAHRYRTLSMDEVVEATRSGNVPDHAVAIHFDDGWANQKNALPILEKLGLKATFWIIGEALPEVGYLAWDEIRTIARKPLFDVHSHTLTHPCDESSNLKTWVAGRPAGKSIADARRELIGSKLLIERQIGMPVRYLAWPCGLYNDELIGLAIAAGYEALATVDRGLTPTGDVLRIRRAIIDGTCDLDAFVEVLSSPRNQYPCTTPPDKR